MVNLEVNKFEKVYRLLKKIVLLALPQTFLNKSESFFRKLYSLLYIGNKVYCPICQKHFSRFIVLENGDKLCPACGSLPRHRRLWVLITKENPIKQNDIILHFSPERCITGKLKEIYRENYHTTDYNKKSNTQLHFDITNIAAERETYSYIICYHVLEHIENDIQAMKELYRILKKGGKVIIQTPFKEGDIYENAAIITKQDRLKHFGQDDHVRIYSVEGLRNRLESVGFCVTLMQYGNNQSGFYGFKDKETILICENIYAERA